MQKFSLLNRVDIWLFLNLKMSPSNNSLNNRVSPSLPRNNLHTNTHRALLLFKHFTG